MDTIDLTSAAYVPLATLVVGTVWKLAVLFRVTATGYVYKKGRWGDVEIRPADSKPPGGHA